MANPLANPAPTNLDRSRPYGEVHGLPGAAFEQDGIKYKFDGSVATDISPIIDEVHVSEKEENPPSNPCIEMQTIPNDEEAGKSLEDMHWKRLKILVETYGGAWTTRPDAIKFIRGK